MTDNKDILLAANKDAGATDSNLHELYQLGGIIHDPVPLAPRRSLEGACRRLVAADASMEF